MLDVTTGLEQHIEQAQPRLDGQRLAGFLQLDAVAALRVFGRRQFGRGKTLDVRMGIAEAFAGAFERVEHRRRTAAIKMRVVGLASQVGAEVWRHAFFVVEVVDHLGAQAAEFFHQCGFLARTGAVDQLGGFSQGQ
ncbi:hypothetical protein D3C72_2015610 [compost metagenome]